MSVNLAVLDLETDPFEHGRIVQPFLSGFYDGTRLISFWSANCIERLVNALDKLTKEYIIYAHNGGRFDFFYFLPYLVGRGGPGNDMRIINGRIVQARLGKHQLRDSFAIMPFALADYDKDVIDYQKFREEVRESHKTEIQKYFRRDLTALYELVTAFHVEFGDKLTVGSAAMKEIKRFHKFDTGSKQYDQKLRKDFYFGGRNQVFQGGVFEGDIRVYDVNSMYPHAMRSELHPIGTDFRITGDVEKDSVFVVAEGHNYGALPQRQKDGSLDFNVPYGRFACTVHEWRAAIETGTFKPERVIKAYSWDKQATFEEFVDHFYAARLKADTNGDKIRKLFYKFVLNSGYGKFAQNPENYFDWFITDYSARPPKWHDCDKSCVDPCPKYWRPSYVFESSYIIWKKPLSTQTWYNIAIGASITGAARATLLRGICDTDEPLYCDTDSIICRGATRVPVHASRLGFWDLEAIGSLVAIAGKKLYAIFDCDVARVEAMHAKAKKAPPEIVNCSHGRLALVKKAHKGARLTGAEILRIAQGEKIISYNPVPSFKWDGTATFTKREISKTYV